MTPTHLSDPPPLPAEGAEAETYVFPASFAQRRLWLIDRLEPGSPAYVIPLALRLRGPLDALALRDALDSVVARHEALRTTFADEDGEPVQVVSAQGWAGWDEEDLSALAADTREAEVEAQALEEARRPFDLGEGPLVRARLLRLAEEEHVLLLSLHHVVGDGWSLGILFRELGAFYGAYTAGGEAELPDLPVQYADFTLWQRERLAGDALEQQVAWWRAALDGAPALLELPTDHPRPAAMRHRGASVRAVLPRAESEAVAALCRAQGATPFMVLLAAWQLLLSRWSGQTDVVVGSPIAGRTRREMEGLIGFFVNLLALRGDLSGDPTFRELVARTRETTLGAFAHQELPFERLVEELKVERSLSHGAVFQVLFLVQNASGAPHVPGLRVEPLELDSGTAKMDLALEVEESPVGLRLHVQYDTDLFDRGTAQRILAGYQALLRDAAARPDVPVSDLAMLPPSQRDLVLNVFNETERYHPAHLRIHDLFAAQAARTPDAVAVESASDSLTYAELDARANRLAHHLRSLGVGPETLVAVCCERTPDLVVAMLGVLKAGGAYVPVDPAYPAARIADMLADTGAPVLLTRDRLVATLPETAARVVRLDADRAEIERHPATSPEVDVLPENLAYAIYTSGSTGRPKGVQIEHRSTVALLHWLKEQVTDEERARVLGSTSASFDVSIAEVFGTLCWGGTLVLVENALSLAEMADDRVVLASMVPSAAAELLRMGGIPASVRTLNLGGEALPADLARRLHAETSVEKVVNLYGPTEDTTYTTWWEAPADAEKVLVGRPVANTRLYVLDERLNPVPVGVPGELYIAGAGLARCYGNRAGMTAERWVPCPFGGPGERMYRVGDRVRWLASGEVEWICRLDQQVKVRGFRIETGEVEAALRTHPAVLDAAVIAREDTEGDRKLVGYVVPRAGATVEASALRAHLRARLPDHMVPSLFVGLPALPLSPNGKVDRKALPAPKSVGEAVRAAPRTQTEQLLAGIWAEVLDVGSVGADDGFFDLGGHSLTATRVTARVRDVFHVELPLRALFESPTLAEMAARIDALLASDGGRPALPALVPVPRLAPIPLSFAQRRLWFLDRMGTPGATYHIALVMRMRGRLDADALERALAEVVRRHEALRTVFRTVDGDPVQVAREDAALDLRRADLPADGGTSGDVAASSDAAIAAWVEEETGRPFDLAADLPLRAALARVGEDDHVLALTLHHAAGDGWSLGVLSRELDVLYRAFSAGEGSPLAPIAVQYADFAHWQRGWLRGGELERQVAFWRGHLAGAPVTLELPADRPRPPVQSFRGATHRFRLPREAADGVRALARAEGATPFMVLLAAWQVLLSRWSGQADVVVGTPIAGRTRRETEGLIGFFVNTLAIRGDLSADPTFSEHLARVRETTLEAHAHQDLPFEKLVEELGLERSLAHTPLFQTMFVLQEAPVHVLSLPGLSLSPADPESRTAKFDLTLGAMETADGLEAAMEYAADLFDADTIARLADHLRVLLAAALAEPDTRVSRLPLLDAAGRAEVLALGRGDLGDEAEAEDVPLHRLVERRAAQAPDAPALVAEDGAVTTYGELVARAGRLARRLAAVGVGPETPVGILLERSPELVVAQLAVLTAGGCFVPLDPAQPAARLQRMMADSGMVAVVTATRLTGAVPAGIPAVALDSASAGEDDGAGAAPPLMVGRSGAAYVIFTSGSTGAPKGVVVPHAGAVNLARWYGRLFGLGPGDRTTLLAGVGFDASVMEAWPALAAGAAVHVVGDATRADARALRDRLLADRVAVCFLPTPLAEVVLALDWPAEGSPRALIAGGEALLGRPRPGSPFALWNAYGPTEASVAATVGVVEPDPNATRAPSIGSAVGGMRVHVLDAAMEPVPVGVAGEIYVGGEGLARGYAGRPDLTAERFVPDPLSGEHGARLYRTGDRARLRPDGTLEFLGRTDAQLKVRGFRIEPGEVEAALRSHPGVAEAVVDARPGAAGERRLVAWIVPAGEDTPSASALREHLRARLPEYMVPPSVVAVDALPLTPSGKVDRAALPDPVASGEEGAPASEAEARLAAIWAEVLGVERVGPDDGFFDLGGHSLLLARVQERVRQETGHDLPIMDLFRFPTVRQLAARIAGDGDEGEESARAGQEVAESRRALRARRRDARRGGA